MHLFLKGARGIGKSTLLREALLPYQDKLSGFMVQRLFEGETQIGFRALLLNGYFPPLEAKFEAGMEGVFILRGQKDIAIFEKIIVQIEENTRRRNSHIIVLDEIGGLELGSSLFLSTLLRVLSNGNPCIGVLKSQENLQHTLSALQLEDHYFNLNKMLERVIASNGEILDYHSNCKIAKRVYNYVAREANMLDKRTVNE